jgi:hypothetical protein
MAAVEYKTDFSIDRLQQQETPHGIFQEGLWPRATTPTLSPLRFTPLHPAHPGRIQDDGARQVSWLAGSLLGPPSQDKSQWLFRTSLAGYSCGGSADFIPGGSALA